MNQTSTNSNDKPFNLKELEGFLTTIKSSSKLELHAKNKDIILKFFGSDIEKYTTKILIIEWFPEDMIVMKCINKTYIINLIDNTIITIDTNLLKIPFQPSGFDSEKKDMFHFNIRFK